MNLEEASFSPLSIRFVAGVRGEEDDPGLVWFYKQHLDRVYDELNGKEHTLCVKDYVIQIHFSGDLAAKLRMIGHVGASGKYFHLHLKEVTLANAVSLNMGTSDRYT